MLKSDVKKIFNLEGYIFDKMEDTNDGIILHCHLQRKSMTLNSENSKNINETRNRLISHAIFEDKKVFIAIKQRRFYFPKQKKKQWESLPQVKKNQQMTTNFKKSPYLN